MLSYLRNLSEETKSMLKVLVILSIIALVFLYITFEYIMSLSAFSVGLVKYVISLSLLWTVDKIAFRKVDTLDLVSRQPLAYAVFFLANAILIVACISMS